MSNQLIKFARYSSDLSRHLNRQSIHTWIAQSVANQLCTIEVVGSNPDKGEDFSLKNLNFSSVQMVYLVSNYQMHTHLFKIGELNHQLIDKNF